VAILKKNLSRKAAADSHKAGSASTAQAGAEAKTSGDKGDK
jgi:hypothetical protein